LAHTKQSMRTGKRSRSGNSRSLTSAIIFVGDLPPRFAAQHALQLTRELRIARGFAARFYLIPSQLNSGVDMTGLLSRENWNGMDLR